MLLIIHIRIEKVTDSRFYFDFFDHLFLKPGVECPILAFFLYLCERIIMIWIMGKRSEFEYVFKTYYAQLFSYAGQLVDREEDCHDIVSEAYEAMWRNWEYIHVETAKTYLYTCVRNKCLNRLRHVQTHRQYVAHYIKQTEPYACGEELAERIRRERAVREAIEEICPPVRDVVKACLIKGKKYKEAAEDFGMSLSLVKKHMVRAMAIIRENAQKKARSEV